MGRSDGSWRSARSGTTSTSASSASCDWTGREGGGGVGQPQRARRRAHHVPARRRDAPVHPRSPSAGVDGNACQPDEAPARRPVGAGDHDGAGAGRRVGRREHDGVRALGDDGKAVELPALLLPPRGGRRPRDRDAEGVCGEAIVEASGPYIAAWSDRPDRRGVRGARRGPFVPRARVAQPARPVQRAARSTSKQWRALAKGGLQGSRTARRSRSGSTAPGSTTRRHSSRPR
jgi:hypothetical protein